MRWSRPLVLLLVLAVGLAPAGATAQDRALAWPRFEVTAHLDSVGTLHIRERQTMRFHGDWNGGERRFDLRNGHTLALRRLSRIPAVGPALALVEGDLDKTDEFAWSDDGRSLRWRARQPSDPPFDDDTLVYELEYETGRILRARGEGRYELDHNFAIVERDGDIDRFRLTLTLDDAWAVPDGFTGAWEAGPLRPGEGWRVTLPLGYRRAGAPPGVRLGAGDAMRQAVAGALVAWLLVLLVRLLRREAALGRLQRPPTREAITPEFLEQHVLSHLPEAVGAAWDDHTSAPEVAAILARLVQEGKLSSRIESTKVLWATQQELHLTRESHLSEFRPHERALLDGLFADGSRTTSTAAVRARYKKTGFDPASLIRKPVETLVGTAMPDGSAPSWKPTALLVLVGLGLVAAGLVSESADVPGAMATLGGSLAVFVVAALSAYAWRQAASIGVMNTTIMLLPLAAMVTAFVVLLLLQPVEPLGAVTLLGLGCWLAGLGRSVLNVGASRHSAQRIAFRQRLAGARAFFAEELRQPRPALQDQWYPYVIAFGLGRAADKWFAAFGGTGAREVVLAGGAAGGRSGPSGGGGWTGFGGGGGFAGGGTSASFAAAVGGMAASVPSPSSGGGGSSGGGSSGGGGGGGW